MANHSEKKEPIYKQWWLWLTVITIICFFIGVLLVKIKVDKEINALSTNSDTYNKTLIMNEEKEVIVIDFSQMTQEEIKKWCTTNKVECDISKQYSDTVAQGGFISQSEAINGTIHEGDKITVIYSLGKEPTLGEKNALSTANSYLRTMAFSYSGLIDQLEYEGYTTTEAIYGAENCGADWNEQAAKMAKSYINTMSFSRSGLINQLKYEGFTAEQAQYGASAVGY